MSQRLYTLEILRLGANIPHHQRLVEPHGSAERRSPICGSRVAIDVILDHAGRIASLGLEVRACALGQASAALLGQEAVGRSLAELAAARDALSDYLLGTCSNPGAWPGLALFADARSYTARHPSIRLAFEAAAEAVEDAMRRGATPRGQAASAQR